MRKVYSSPELEIEKFLLPTSSLITTSENGFEDSDTGEDVGDDF